MGPNELTQETLFRVLYEIKNKGLSICLTHGTFDLFHYTHLDMLNKSSKVADVLVVGVEADRRVKEYKPNRPVIDEDSRISMISQLGFVDYVFKKDIEFNSVERLKLYKEFNIDFLTIGDNYHKGALKGLSQDCKEANTHLVKLDVIKRYTTSNIINRVVNEEKY